MKRASINLGINGSGGEGGAHEIAELKIENERLQTTIYLLD